MSDQTEDTRAVQARFSAAEFQLIDDWRRAQPIIPTVAESVRTLVRLGLQNQGSERTDG